MSLTFTELFRFLLKLSHEDLLLALEYIERHFKLVPCVVISSLHLFDDLGDLGLGDDDE